MFSVKICDYFLDHCRRCTHDDTRECECDAWIVGAVFRCLNKKIYKLNNNGHPLSRDCLE